MPRLWKKLIKQVHRVPWAWSWQYNTPLVEPPAYLVRWRGRQVWFIILALCVSLGLSLVMLVLNVAVGSLWNAVVWLALVFLLCGWTIASSRMRMRLARNRFEACLDCGYSLRGLPGRGHCPECGTKYEIMHVRHVWRAYLWRKWRRRR